MVMSAPSQAAQPADELGARPARCRRNRAARRRAADRPSAWRIVIDFASPMADDVRIRRASGRADFDACVLLQRAVWGLADLEITSAIQLIATTHAGGMLHLAETADGEPVGFAYAFPALRGGVPHLHSDMLAVLPGVPEARRRRAPQVGAARGGARARHRRSSPGPTIRCRRATRTSNLRRLGGRGHRVPGGLLRRHDLRAAPRPADRPPARALGAELAAASRERVEEGEPPRTRARARRCPRINDVKWQAGWPVSSEPRLDLEAPELLLEIPPDWDVLAKAAPRVAADWQGKVRRALQAYFGRGYVAADFAPTEEKGRRRPLYILQQALAP